MHPYFGAKNYKAEMYQEKAVQSPFVQKTRESNVDEINPQVSEGLLELIWLNVEVLWMWIDLDTHRTLKINLQSSGCCRVFQKWHLLQSDVLMLRQISATG